MEENISQTKWTLCKCVELHICKRISSYLQLLKFVSFNINQNPRQKIMQDTALPYTCTHMKTSWKRESVLGFSRETELMEDAGSGQMELAYAIMEAKKSQHLSQQTGDPESPQCKFQLEHQQAQDPRRTDISVWVWSQKKTNVLVQGNWAREVSSYSVLLSYSDLQLIGCPPRTPILRRITCFTQSIDSNVNHILEHSHRHTKNNARRNIQAPCGPVELTHKINHH